MGSLICPKHFLTPKVTWTKLQYFFRALYTHLTCRLLKPKYKVTKSSFTTKIPVSYQMHTDWLHQHTQNHSIKHKHLLRTFSKPCRRAKVQLNMKRMKKQNKVRQRAEHSELECKKSDGSAVCERHISTIRLRSNLKQVQLLPSACFLG